MKTALSVLAVALVFAFTIQTRGEEDKPKEVTLKGKLVCGKCTLKETDGCSNVLQVTKGEKTVNYYLKDKAKGEPYHKGICPPNSSKEVTITGTVTKKDDKMWLTVSKLEEK